MRMVVDASVAVKWLVLEEGSTDADQLLEGQHELYAPRLLASEVGNVI
jgi:predicted nucleic acid-binding protein